MMTSSSQETSTTAKIVMTEPGMGVGINLATQFVDTIGFTYSSDPTIIGDPFTVAVPNPQGVYTNQFPVGTQVKLFLQNPKVNGGALTHKQTGLIIRRRATSSAQGTTIFLECADLGWHLLNNDAPLFARLEGETPIESLLKRPEWIDPSWGISYEPKYDNLTNRAIKLNNGRVEQEINLSPTVGTPVQRIQVEPGDKVSDLLVKYAKRKNCFVNVNVEGHIQFWNPNENQSVKYHIDYHPLNSSQNRRNNVLEATLEEDLSNQWTEVTCVGDKLITVLMGADPSKINGTKVRGMFPDPSKPPPETTLPFSHRLIFSDGEIWKSKDAGHLAQWKHQRGQYDSWKLTYLVQNHHQQNTWWEADTLCTVNDTVHGVRDSCYVSAVTYIRDEQGDRTQVTLRKRGLLRAFIEGTNANNKPSPRTIEKRKPNKRSSSPK